MPPGEPPAAGGERIAVCSLSSRELLEPLSELPGVALVGTLMTANLGIEELVRTLARRPAIRTLLVCGRDSPRFHAGQSLLALFRRGVDADCRRIRGAAGYLPVLPTVSLADVERVRSRVELVDAVGECDPSVLRELVAKLSPPEHAGVGPAGRERAAARPPQPAHGDQNGFRRLRAGGRRSGISGSLNGFVVISLDRRARLIVLRHYDNDLTPRHEMTGTRAESMLLGLLNARVIHEPSHAGYLGGELTKAETALRLGLEYDQDLPLRAPRASVRLVRPVPARREVRAISEPPKHRLSLAEFLSAVVDGLGAQGTELDPHVPLGVQLSVDSARMIELAIVLEEELGLDLPPDIDLRRSSPLELYGTFAA